MKPTPAGRPTPGLPTGADAPTQARPPVLPLLDRDLGLNRVGMERVGSRAAFVLLGAIAALVLVCFGLGALAEQPMSVHRVRAVGQTTVTVGSTSGGFRLHVPAGWSKDLTSSSRSSLVLVRAGLRTTVATQGGVADAPTFYARRLRLLSFEGLPGLAVDTVVRRGDPSVVIGDIDGQGTDGVEAVLVRRNGRALTVTTSTVDGNLPDARRRTAALVNGISR